MPLLSSISWLSLLNTRLIYLQWLLFLFIRYFLNLFGLRGLFSLILGEENGQSVFRFKGFHFFTTLLNHDSWKFFVFIFTCLILWEIDMIFLAAMDDTQRMMQMGGFGFDPSKVHSLCIYCLIRLVSACIQIHIKAMFGSAIISLLEFDNNRSVKRLRYNWIL